jgi:hypothetical protein
MFMEISLKSPQVTELNACSELSFKFLTLSLQPAYKLGM